MLLGVLRTPRGDEEATIARSRIHSVTVPIPLSTPTPLSALTVQESFVRFDLSGVPKSASAGRATLTLQAWARD